MGQYMLTWLSVQSLETHFLGIHKFLRGVIFSKNHFWAFCGNIFSQILSFILTRKLGTHEGKSCSSLQTAQQNHKMLSIGVDFHLQIVCQIIKVLWALNIIINSLFFKTNPNLNINVTRKKSCRFLSYQSTKVPYYRKYPNLVRIKN